MFTLRPLSPQETPPLSLLLTANPSLSALEDDLAHGVCHLLSNSGGTVLGAAILREVGPATMEIMAIAIEASVQQQGLGQRLLNHLTASALNQGATTLFVGTANSSLAQLGFYQKAGFRLSHIVPNHFLDHYDQPIFENGLQALDMVYLKLTLT